MNLTLSATLFLVLTPKQQLRLEWLGACVGVFLVCYGAVLFAAKRKEREKERRRHHRRERRKASPEGEAR